LTPNAAPLNALIAEKASSAAFTGSRFFLTSPSGTPARISPAAFTIALFASEKTSGSFAKSGTIDSVSGNPSCISHLSSFPIVVGSTLAANLSGPTLVSKPTDLSPPVVTSPFNTTGPTGTVVSTPLTETFIEPKERLISISVGMSGRLIEIRALSSLSRPATSHP
jgi:hypothetical protein